MRQAIIMGTRFANACYDGAYGNVHSVFERAVNIELPGHGADISLLTLLCAGLDVSPTSLITSMNGDSWVDYCKVGNSVIFTKDAVCFGSVPFVGGISDATIWRTAGVEAFSALPELSCEEIATRCERVKSYLDENRIITTLFDIDTLENFDVLSFLGHGLGLTPSGDDFLAGILFAIHFAQMVYKRKCEALPAITERVLKNMSAKTNQISRHFLRCATEGLWGRSTERFMLALFGDDNVALNNAIQEKASYGATSGIDEIQGIMFGLYESVRLFGEG